MKPYAVIYLSKRETADIENIYGLWDFCHENLFNQTTVLVWEF